MRSTVFHDAQHGRLVDQIEVLPLPQTEKPAVLIQVVRDARLLSGRRVEELPLERLPVIEVDTDLLLEVEELVLPVLVFSESPPRHSDPEKGVSVEELPGARDQVPRRKKGAALLEQVEHVLPAVGLRPILGKKDLDLSRARAGQGQVHQHVLLADPQELGCSHEGLFQYTGWGKPRPDGQVYDLGWPRVFQGWTT